MDEGQRVVFCLEVQSSFPEVCFLLGFAQSESVLHYKTQIDSFAFMGFFCGFDLIPYLSMSWTKGCVLKHMWKKELH